MSIVADFYTTIMNRVMDAGLSIAHFDWWNEQIELEDENLAFPVPAVFFEYNPLDTVMIGNRKQYIDVIFRLHVVHDVVEEVSYDEDNAIRTAGLSSWDLIDSLNTLMIGFNQSGVFSSIGKDGQDIPHNYGLVQDKIMSFRCRLFDCSGEKQLQQTPKSPLNQCITVN